MKQRRARVMIGILAAAALVAPAALRAQGDTGAGATGGTTGGSVNPPAQTDQYGTGATGATNDAAGGTTGASGAAGGSTGGTSSDIDPAAAGRGGDLSGQTGDTTATGVEASSKGLSDRQITVRVREAVVENQAGGSSFRGVKVSTKSGKVTLKGKVGTQAEKDEAGAKAAAIVGSDNVNNELTVRQ